VRRINKALHFISSELELSRGQPKRPTGTSGSQKQERKSRGPVILPELALAGAQARGQRLQEPLVRKSKKERAEDLSSCQNLHLPSSSSRSTPTGTSGAQDKQSFAPRGQRLQEPLVRRINKALHFISSELQLSRGQPKRPTGTSGSQKQERKSRGPVILPELALAGAQARDQPMRPTGTSQSHQVKLTLHAMLAIVLWFRTQYKW
jgi:hypothetical protein